LTELYPPTAPLVDTALPASKRGRRLHAREAHAPAWADARVQRNYGGTTEIMKEIVARDLVGRPTT